MCWIDYSSTDEQRRSRITRNYQNRLSYFDQTNIVSTKNELLIVSILPQKSDYYTPLILYKITNMSIASFSFRIILPEKNYWNSNSICAEDLSFIFPLIILLLVLRNPNFWRGMLSRRADVILRGCVCVIGSRLKLLQRASE